MCCTQACVTVGLAKHLREEKKEGGVGDDECPQEVLVHVIREGGNVKVCGKNKKTETVFPNRLFFEGTSVLGATGRGADFFSFIRNHLPGTS